MLLRLAGLTPQTRVTVRVSYLEIDGVGTGGQRGLWNAPGPPNRNPLHHISFQAADVTGKPGRFDLAPHAVVLARKISTPGQWDVSFRYRPTRATAANDYYYVRVVQVDGETAWTSPVFVGQ